jgi:4-amino-4-deoxy-L-arabinose transferase-like glycosyltransferase
LNSDQMSDMEGGRGPGVAVIVGVALLLLSLAARFIDLGADPVNPYWSGWVSDEGRWTETAREWASFRAIDLSSPLSRTHLLLAPAYQFALGLVFLVTGPGLVVARLVSALAGIVLLAVTAFTVRGVLGRTAALVAVVGVAAHPEILYYSRVAIPEIPALVFLTGAFLVLVRSVGGRWAPVWAGLLFALAAGTKGTLLPVLPAFAAIAAIGAPAGRRWRDPAFFVGTVGGVALAAAFVASSFLGLGSLFTGGGGLGDVAEFLAPDQFEEMVKTLYEGGYTIWVNVLLAVLWVPTVLFLRRPSLSTPDRVLFASSLCWAFGWFAVWAVLDYFAARYLVHLHLPLILAVAASLSIASREGMDDGSPWGEGAGRFVWMAILALPLGLALAPAATNLVNLLGPTLDRFRHQMVIAGILTALVAWRARGLPRGEAARLLTVVPPALGICWFVAMHVGWVPRSFRAVDGLAGVGRWVAIGGGAAVISALALRMTSPSRTVLGPVTLLVGLGFASTNLGADPPRRSLQEAAAFVDARYPRGTEVGVLIAGSAMIDTELRAIELEPSQVARFPDRLLVHLGGRVSEEALDGFELIRTFEVDFGSRFEFAHEFSDSTSIRLYERR